MKVSLISLFCWAKGFHISNPQQLVGSTEQTPVNVMRIDRDSPYSNNKSFHLLTTTQQPQVILKALSADEAFLVRLTCPSIPADVCQKVNTALQNAGKRLVSNLLITRQIILKATFRSFCGGQPASTCQRANTLGSATYGSAFVVAEGDTHYTYNQALVKQLQTDVSPPFSDTDIVAEFNADASWYFREDGGQISSRQTDLEYVAAHELTHGLGFGSGLLEYSSVFGSFVQSGYLAPLPINATQGEFTDSTLVSALEPVDIFDSFITGSRFSFKDLAKDIESFGNQNTQAADFLRSFERSGKPMEAAQKLFQESTRGQNQLFFNARDGTKISLYSPARFEQGSSISHVASSNAVTENFLMIPSLSPGVTLEAVMQRAGATSVYGADIQKVLETVGWPTPASSNLKSIKISLGFSGVSKGGASSNFGLIGLLTGFAVSILI